MSTEMHSVHSDIWTRLKAETTEKTPRAAQRFAELRSDLNDLESELRATFDRIDTARQALEDGGVVAQMKLSPILDAAYQAYLRAEAEKPGAKLLTEVTEPPIGPELP